MSTGMKILGIIGAGAIVALGIFGSEPDSSTTITPSAIVAPKSEEIKPVPSPTVTSEVKPVVTAPSVPPAVEPKPVSNCHSSYSGCLKMNVGDYDCASGSGNGPNYTGAVQVYGSDPFDLDRDGDGWGCD